MFAMEGDFACHKRRSCAVKDEYGAVERWICLTVNNGRYRALG